MQVGDRVWIFDENNRVYRDAAGNETLSPWYRGHFVEHFVVGETRHSWILARSATTHPKRGFKIPKKDAEKHVFVSEEAVEKACWVQSNRYRIAKAVEESADYDMLRQIGEILNINGD
ncbi:hypothetical protein CEB3_c13360 [Peptococcaceae bacterium CEB3]|nr:hypothetical protein CEB3_c13360 [Peptococcaceae bacterium CEB3]